MKTPYIVRAYIESILNEYPEIDCGELISVNRSTLMDEFGYDERAVDRLERGLKSRFYYWRKFTRTKPANIQSDIDPTLDETDIKYIKALTNDKIIRIPMSSVHWDESKNTYVTNRNRSCDLVAIEKYTRGDFAAEFIFPYDGKVDFVEDPFDPNAVRYWAYVNISSNNTPVRAY